MPARKYDIMRLFHCRTEDFAVALTTLEALLDCFGCVRDDQTWPSRAGCIYGSTREPTTHEARSAIAYALALLPLLRFFGGRPRAESVFGADQDLLEGFHARCLLYGYVGMYCTCARMQVRWLPRCFLIMLLGI